MEKVYESVQRQSTFKLNQASNFLRLLDNKLVLISTEMRVHQDQRYSVLRARWAPEHQQGIAKRNPKSLQIRSQDQVVLYLSVYATNILTRKSGKSRGPDLAPGFGI